jgi:hypothetical protein
MCAGAPVNVGERYCFRIIDVKPLVSAARDLVNVGRKNISVCEWRFVEERILPYRLCRTHHAQSLLVSVTDNRKLENRICNGVQGHGFHNKMHANPFIGLHNEQSLGQLNECELKKGICRTLAWWWLQKGVSLPLCWSPGAGVVFRPLSKVTRFAVHMCNNV